MTPRQYTARQIARLFNVPDHMIGIPTVWWRKWIQVHITRRP